MIENRGHYSINKGIELLKNGELDYLITNDNNMISLNKNGDIKFNKPIQIIPYMIEGYLINFRDEYWKEGNYLTCANGNIYKVTSEKLAEIEINKVKTSMEELFKYAYDKKFDYGVNKEWNIVKVEDSNNEIIWSVNDK